MTVEECGSLLYVGIGLLSSEKETKHKCIHRKLKNKTKAGTLLFDFQCKIFFEVKSNVFFRKAPCSPQV